MLKSISIITGFMAAMIMPIAAVEIENHDANPGFIKQIADCYKRVPNALLARVENPRIVADDGIIRTDHKSDAQIAREFVRKRR